MAVAQDEASARVPDSIERFAKQLSITYKALRLYPLGSAIPGDAVAGALAALGRALQSDPVVLVDVTKDGLHYEGLRILPGSESFTAFGREFYSRNLAEVRFHAGLTAADMSYFLKLLDVAPEEIASQGGFEAALWQTGTTNITVTEVSTRIVDQEIDAEVLETVGPEVDHWPPLMGEIDELIDAAASGSQRDQRVLVRVMRDPRLVAAYLREALAPTRGVAGFVDLVARLSALARAVQSELPDDQAALLRSLSDAFMELEPSDRAKLFRSRLLEEARRDDRVAEVVQQIGLDAALDSIVFTLDETPAAVSGLARALRNLGLIKMAASREQLLSAAAEKMRSAGASEGFIEAVEAAAEPRQLAVRERTRSADIQPVATVLALLEMAPSGSPALIYDESLDPLRAEAARGTTDADVIATLVTLATIERRPEQFASVMSLLEDGIGLLVDQQEFEIAADCAEALVAASEAPDVEEPQRKRIRRVLDALAAPEPARKITGALRLYRSDAPEHRACRRLLAALGGSTIGGLLEVLADEQDMSSRKAVVDLISKMAGGYIPELGARVSDPRWYFVRNVAAILGSTRAHEALAYLQRTLRHSDARVRRETIRALMSIRDTTSDKMLISALADEDAQNVQLAARYLGSLACRAAAPGLADAASGKGPGNRDNAPRIEAIEALGRIGDPSSVAVLQKLARKRWFFGGRERDVRAAADRALRAFGARASAPGGGEPQ